jgi:hypothetical protein
MIESSKRDEVAVELRARSTAGRRAVPLYEDELVLVVHQPRHAATSSGSRTLADEHFVLFDRASSYHELTNALFLEAGIAPRSVGGARQRRFGERWSHWASALPFSRSSRSPTRYTAEARASLGSRPTAGSPPDRRGAAKDAAGAPTGRDGCVPRPAPRARARASGRGVGHRVGICH